MAVYKYILVYLLSCLCCVLCELNIEEYEKCVTKEGHNGTCIEVSRCWSTRVTEVYVKAGFKMENHNFPGLPDICTYKKNKTIICCTDCSGSKGYKKLSHEYEDDYVVGLYSELARINGSIAKAKCYEYFHRLPYADCHCLGFRYDRSWIEDLKCHSWGYTFVSPSGGRDAKQWEFPHMALLGYGEDPQSAQWLCGGSVISEKFILTAAHCSSAPSLGNISFAALEILKRADVTKHGIIYNIKRIIIHPEYKSPSKYHDIALLETENEFKFSIRLLPACLQLTPSFNPPVQACGWGRLGQREGLADTLQAVYLDEYSEAECAAIYKPHRLLKNGYDHEKQTCFGRRDEVVNTCQCLNVPLWRLQTKTVVAVGTTLDPMMTIYLLFVLAIIGTCQANKESWYRQLNANSDLRNYLNQKSYVDRRSSYYDRNINDFDIRTSGLDDFNVKRAGNLNRIDRGTPLATQAIKLSTRAGQNSDVWKGPNKGSTFSETNGLVQGVTDKIFTKPIVLSGVQFAGNPSDSGVTQAPNVGRINNLVQEDNNLRSNEIARSSSYNHENYPNVADGLRKIDYLRSFGLLDPIVRAGNYLRKFKRLGDGINDESNKDLDSYSKETYEYNGIARNEPKYVMRPAAQTNRHRYQPDLKMERIPPKQDVYDTVDENASDDNNSNDPDIYNPNNSFYSDASNDVLFNFAYGNPNDDFDTTYDGYWSDNDDSEVSNNNPSDLDYRMLVSEFDYFRDSVTISPRNNKMTNSALIVANCDPSNKNINKNSIILENDNSFDFGHRIILDDTGPIFFDDSTDNEDTDIVKINSKSGFMNVYPHRGKARVNCQRHKSQTPISKVTEESTLFKTIISKLSLPYLLPALLSPQPLIHCEHSSSKSCNSCAQNHYKNRNNAHNGNHYCGDHCSHDNSNKYKSHHHNSHGSAHSHSVSDQYHSQTHGSNYGGWGSVTGLDATQKSGHTSGGKAALYADNWNNGNTFKNSISHDTGRSKSAASSSASSSKSTGVSSATFGEGERLPQLW